MATSYNLTNIPTIDMIMSTSNVNTGPSLPNYRTVFTPIANQAYDAITGTSTTTITVTMPQLTANALVFVQLNSSLLYTVTKTAGTGFVITISGTNSAAGTADILVIDFEPTPTTP